MKKHLVLIVLGACLALPAAAYAQKAVLLVRHAEKRSETDERLTDAGRGRAARLAAMLKDAGVGAIYSTDTERTIGTVKPLADALKLPVQIYETAGGAGRQIDSGPFVERLRRQNGNDVVLVVGHSNTVPALLKALGCPGEITIAPTEYDNLFVVVPRLEGPPTLLRLRY